MKNSRIPAPILAVGLVVGAIATYIFGGKRGRDFVRSFGGGGGGSNHSGII